MTNSLQTRIAKILADQKLRPADLARLAGVTRGAVSQWRNEMSTAMSYQAAQQLSARLGYSVEWLMKGEGPEQHHTAQEPSAAAYTNPNGVVERVITAFGWLTRAQQDQALADLEAKAEANKAISKELGPKWEFTPDAQVARHIAPAPTAEPKKPRPPDRDPGTAMDDFLGDN